MSLTHPWYVFHNHVQSSTGGCKEQESGSRHQVHVDKDPALETTTAARKLMHRFKEDEVTKLIDDVEGGRDS
jgi:hypothetical protein